MKTGYIDRFEGEYAMIETGEKTEQFLRRDLPADAKEGDCVIIDFTGIRVDKEATEARKASLQRLMDKLFRPGKGG